MPQLQDVIDAAQGTLRERSGRNISGGPRREFVSDARCCSGREFNEILNHGASNEENPSLGKNFKIKDL